MPDAPAHVFISYVHEDSDAIDELCELLDEARVPYWRDVNELFPGDAWKARIREAIQSNALVFLPCFSDNSTSKQSSYMNEELTIAVDEFRRMPPGRTWIIPVRLSDVTPPDWDLGAGRRLADYQYVDLFGPQHHRGVARLVARIASLMGAAPSPATTQAAVQEATGGDRIEIVQQLTKEMLPDPARQIQLDEMIDSEARTIVTSLRDEATFPSTLTQGGQVEQLVQAAEQATAIRHLLEPFCASLVVSTRWATSERQLQPWTRALRALGSHANRLRGGHTALTALHHIPVLMCTMTVGLAAIDTGRWDNLKALLVDVVVPEGGTAATEPLIDVATPWSPFRQSELVPQVLYAAAREQISVAEAADSIVNRRGQQFYTPGASWLHLILRGSVTDLFPDEEVYGEAYDRAECMLGLISQDIATSQVGAAAGAFGRRSHWYGRATWRSRMSTGALDLIEQELASRGGQWPPLQAGLFGGEVDRARTVMAQYRETFEVIRRTQF